MDYHLNGNNSTIGNSLALADMGEGINNRKRSNWDDKKKEMYKDAIYVQCEDEEQFAKGWGRQGALEYIFYLCGEHCMGQWYAIEEAYQNDQVLLRKKHLEYLKVMEATAAYNLRNSFTVVGLLQETQEFYDMVTQQVEYIDMSLNPTTEGKRHGSGGSAINVRCDAFFQDPALQKRVMAKGPELATLVRLYEVGVQVNQFQKEELAQMLFGDDDVLDLHLTIY